MARQHVTVALSANGGDEMFAGYDAIAFMMSVASTNTFLDGPANSIATRFSRACPTGCGDAGSVTTSAALQERYIDHLAFLPSFERDTPLLSPDFREILKRSDDPANVLRRYFAQAPTRIQSTSCFTLSQEYMVADILTKVDRMSMLNSLEVRVPILDHVFVDG